MLIISNWLEKNDVKQDKNALTRRWRWQNLLTILMVINVLLHCCYDDDDDEAVNSNVEFPDVLWWDCKKE